MPDLSFLFDKEPEEIVRWYQSKGLKISYNWRDIWQEAQVKAFTVAKAMDLDILQDIKSEVVEAIKKGNTYEEFRRNLEPRLKAKGWWGKQDMVNPNTGEMETVQLGSPWRLKTIYRTNLSVAYSAGRYKKFLENAEDRPFWQYNAVLDKRTRPLHALLDGKVFRYDDPFWQTHFPPNDWGCRCSVTALNKRDIDRDGLKVENNSGEWLSKVPAGEGWNYNPGESILNWDSKGNIIPAIENQNSWKTYNRPDVRELDDSFFAESPGLIEPGKNKKEALEILAKALGLSEGKRRFVKTPVEEALIDYSYLPHIVEKFEDHREIYASYIIPTLEDPYEIYLTEYQDGLRRRYIKLFKGKNNLLVVVKINKDGSLLWNMMQSDNKGTNRQRVGSLIYGK